MKYEYSITLYSETTVFSIRECHEYKTSNWVAMVNGDHFTFDEDTWYLWRNNNIVVSGDIKSLHSDRKFTYKVGDDEYTACYMKYTAYGRISV